MKSTKGKQKRKRKEEDEKYGSPLSLHLYLRVVASSPFASEKNKIKSYACVLQQKYTAFIFSCVKV